MTELAWPISATQADNGMGTSPLDDPRPSSACPLDDAIAHNATQRRKAPIAVRGRKAAIAMRGDHCNPRNRARFGRALLAAKLSLSSSTARRPGAVSSQALGSPRVAPTPTFSITP
jgi:hypothetical protein